MDIYGVTVPLPSFIPLFVHSFIRSCIHSIVHSFICSFVLSICQSFIPPYIRTGLIYSSSNVPLIRSSVHFPIFYSSIRFFRHPFSCSFRSEALVHLLIPSLICSFIRYFTRLLIHASIRTLFHLFVFRSLSSFDYCVIRAFTPR